MTRSTSRDALESLFVEDALPEDPQALWRELQEDEGARAHFENLAYAARALEDAPRSSMERALGEATFLAALDEQLAREHEPEPSNVIPLFSRLRPWVALGVAAAAVALVSTQITQDPAAPTDTFQPRSATSTPKASTAKSPEIQAYCVEVNDGRVQFTGPEDAPFGVVTCPEHAELKLAYLTHDPRFAYVAALGVDAEGSIHWYGPSPASPDPIAARLQATPVPLGESIVLSVNHKPGAVRVHAVFSSEPLGYDTVKTWVEGAQRQGDSLFAPDAFLDTPKGVVTTHTTFEIKEVLR